MYNIVLNRPEALVVDDFLPDNVWKKIYNQIQVDKWTNTKPDDKFWHYTDGVNYKNQKRFLSNGPFNDNSDLWFEYFTNFLNNCDEVKSFAKDYVEIAMRCHSYPVGGKNPWHNDLGFTTYTYYLHKHWQINWDATLLIIPYDKVKYDQILSLEEGTVHHDSYTQTNSPMEMFQQKEKYQPIMDYGLGFFVSPKPNRLILINKKVNHGITRVDPDAGENQRVTLTGMIMESDWRETNDLF
jgi:hypothetical protein